LSAKYFPGTLPHTYNIEDLLRQNEGKKCGEKDFPVGTLRNYSTKSLDHASALDASAVPAENLI